MPAPLPSPTPQNRPKTTLINPTLSARQGSSRKGSGRRPPTTGKSNKPSPLKLMQRSSSTPSIIVPPPQVPLSDFGDDEHLPRAGVPTSLTTPTTHPALSRNYSTNNLTGTVKLEQPRERRLQMCTFNRPMIPDTAKWESETQAKLGKGEYHDNYEYLDMAREKETFIKEENDKIMFDKAKRRLGELAHLKFGSVHNMFKMFDYDGSGTVTLEEFSRGLKRRNLEPLFGREQQRILFQHIDTDHNDELDVQEFMDFLGDRDTGQKSSRSSNSQFGRPPRKKETKKMHPAVQRVKDMIVDRLVARRRSHKMDDSQKINSEYLIQVFKQWDEGMSGFLTPDEFCDAIGERHLNLGVNRVDMSKVLDEIDADHNGEISYKEFAKFLQVHDIDPEYNPFFDSRQRAMNSLHKIAIKPWQWQKETDLANEEMARKFGEIERDVSMSQTMEATRNMEMSVTESDGNMFHKTRPHTVDNSNNMSKSMLKKMNTSGQMFDEMRRKNAADLGAICPRFRKQPPTDWNRLGMGRGADPNAGGYYQNIRDATTTNKDYYPPMHILPNQPIQRNLVSDATKGFDEKVSNAGRRKNRTDNNFRVIMERVKMEENMKTMNIDQKLREKSGAMLGYFKQIYATDAKKQKKGGIGATMKKHPEYAHRMWGGDKNSPFHVNNLHHHTVEFRTTSQDFGKHTVGVKKVKAANVSASDDGGHRLKAKLQINLLKGPNEKDPALKIFAGMKR